MITALDTNVLLDVLVADARFAEASQSRMDQAQREGSLVIGEVVYAELAAHFGDQRDLDAFLADTRIQVEPSRRAALAVAARAWRVYLSRRDRYIQCPLCGERQSVVCPACGERLAPRQHILADFLVGGHASIHADRLLTRDRGFYRTYLPALALVTP
jgi:predicted nucleic acid-binding protein